MTIQAFGTLAALAGLLVIRVACVAEEAKAPVAAGVSGTNATPAVSRSTAADPLMTAPLLQATTEGRGSDATEETARRRREQRSAGITNVVPRTVSAHGGPLAYVAHEKKPSSILQLINPFAPSSLGTGSASVFEWRPGEGAAPLPRAFRDERTHEPLGITILGTPR